MEYSVDSQTFSPPLVLLSCSPSTNLCTVQLQFTEHSLDNDLLNWMFPHHGLKLYASFITHKLIHVHHFNLDISQFTLTQ